MNKQIFTLITALLITACAKQSPTTAEEEPAQPGQARMSADVAKQAGIEVAVATAATLHETIKLYGNIQPNPERVRAVSARYPGVIRSVTHQVGAPVKAGETLAMVESNESLQVYAVVAPLAGIVTQRRANPGETAGAEPLFEVADYSKLTAEFTVFARDRPQLKLGLPVQVRAADNEVAATGKVMYIAPIGNPQSQSVMVRVALDNSTHSWSPGQFVIGELTVASREAAITVAPTALQHSKGQAVVFVQTDVGFEARPVEVGRRSNEAVEILSGLNANERYVAKNSYLVKAEAHKSEAEEE